MDNANKAQQNKIKDVAFRIAKATLKAILVYLLYFLVAPMLAPLFSAVPDIMSSIEVFVTIYIVLMILSDLTERTIHQCFFNAARALFIIAYMVFALNDSEITIPVDNFTLTLNLSIIYAISALLGLLGLTKTIMQAISFMSERAEGGLKP